MSESINVFNLIDRLQLSLDEYKKIPLTNKIMIEPSVVKDMLQQVRQTVNPDVATANQILIQREQILSAASAIENQARITAEETMRSANAQAESIVAQATATAQQTVDQANAQANAIVTDANARATDTVNAAAEQANNKLAAAQQEASDMIAEATVRAQQMVEENEITKRAQSQAEELLTNTQNECANFKGSMLASLSQVIDQAGNGLAAQLEAIRSLKEAIPE